MASSHGSGRKPVPQPSRCGCRRSDPPDRTGGHFEARRAPGRLLFSRGLARGTRLFRTWADLSNCVASGGTGSAKQTSPAKPPQRRRTCRRHAAVVTAGFGKPARAVDAADAAPDRITSRHPSRRARRVAISRNPGLQEGRPEAEDAWSHREPRDRLPAVCERPRRAEAPDDADHDRRGSRPRSECGRHETAFALAQTPLGIAYHDREWGVPVHDDRTFFDS